MKRRILEKKELAKNCCGLLEICRKLSSLLFSFFGTEFLGKGWVPMLLGRIQWTSHIYSPPSLLSSELILFSWISLVSVRISNETNLASVQGYFVLGLLDGVRLFNVIVEGCFTSVGLMDLTSQRQHLDIRYRFAVCLPG